ncbi:MAG: glycosyltransferase family 39 protein [bacterium]|nr:glycosyltransferase family 39 protein [bacterium]
MRRPHRQLPWLVGVALVARLVCVLAGVEVPPQDTPDYDEIAHNLLAGEGFVASSNWFGHELRAWRAPLYPVFLVVIYASIDDSHMAVRLVQAALGAATVALVYLLTWRLRAEAAAIAGWLAALYEPLITSANEVMTEVLFTTLLVAGVALAIESRHRSSWRWPMVAGLLLGLATLTRPVGLLAVPAIIAVAAWEDLRGWRAWRRWLPFLGSLSAGVIVAMLPWTARNARVFNAFVPVSTHGGFIVARSNAEAPDWRMPQGWRIDAQTFADCPDEIERDQRWMNEGLQWIAGHPGDWFLLGGERLLRFFYVFRPEYNVAFVVVMPFLLAGLWQVGAHPGFRHLSAVSALSITVFCLVLYGSTRFRLPLEPFFLVFAAVALQAGWRRWGMRFVAGGGAWLACNGMLRLQDESVRQVVVGLLRAGGLK